MGFLKRNISCLRGAQKTSWLCHIFSFASLYLPSVVHLNIIISHIQIVTVESSYRLQELLIILRDKIKIGFCQIRSSQRGTMAGGRRAIVN